MIAHQCADTGPHAWGFWPLVSSLASSGFLVSFQDRCVAALVRVEKTEFLSPVFIGEVAHVSAEITYTSEHSLEVQAKVTAENILTGDFSF